VPVVDTIETIVNETVKVFDLCVSIVDPGPAFFNGNGAFVEVRVSLVRDNAALAGATTSRRVHRRPLEPNAHETSA
jgi:hypothetical protein